MIINGSISETKLNIQAVSRMGCGVSTETAGYHRAHFVVSDSLTSGHSQLSVRDEEEEEEEEELSLLNSEGNNDLPEDIKDGKYK